MKKIKLSIYVKFVLAILTGSIVPIALLSTVILNTMFNVYRDSLKESYTKGVIYSSHALESLIDNYNDVSKIPYYYNLSSATAIMPNYASYDNLRKILTGEAFPDEVDKEKRIKDEMDIFFNNLLNVNNDIAALHFLYEDENSNQTLYNLANDGELFASEETFLKTIDISQIDKTSNDLWILPVHDFDYIGYQFTSKEKVFTVARNYFDITGDVTNKKYIGTLFIDLKLDTLETVFNDVNLPQGCIMFVYNNENTCIYSTDETLINNPLDIETFTSNHNSEQQIILHEAIEKYGLHITFYLDGIPIAQQMRNIQSVMYGFVVFSIIILLATSFLFSGRLTRPILNLKKQMSKVAEGNFPEEIPITSNDELGELTEHFNKMTIDLQNYTNKVYVAEIRQKEAELNALKSQIYPHFLYNTLEVIRMTAVSNNDEKVAKMVEALSYQIRYLIGTMSDTVPLKLEIDILKKYIYLINCRFDDCINFTVDVGDLGEKMIPKLILQPIIENSYKHGIKPKKSDGNISLTAKCVENSIEITIMDDGVGMNAEELKAVENILQSDAPGRKDEYYWNGIGIKNAHDRVRFLYGEQYGISIYSSQGIGTVVKVNIPANILERQRENAENDFSR